jgi:hypothetical protein
VHRHRRELIKRKLPIPEGLREGREYDGATTTTTRTRGRRGRRAYDDVVPANDADVDRPGGHALTTGGGGGGRAPYETGALYQGYGTHYVNLWVGSPVPQRQTVIVDTGLSLTSFRARGAWTAARRPIRALHCITPTTSTVRGTATPTWRGRVAEWRATGSNASSMTAISGPASPPRRRRAIIASAGARSRYRTPRAAAGRRWRGRTSCIIPRDQTMSDRGGMEGGREEGVGAGGTMGVGDDDDDCAGTSTAFNWSDFRLRFRCQERVRSFWRCAHVWRGGGGRTPLIISCMVPCINGTLFFHSLDAFSFPPFDARAFP